MPSDNPRSILSPVDFSEQFFAPAVDDALDAMSIRVLKTPVRTPQANGHCERFIGLLGASVSIG
jgi:hypothetical protein